MSKTSLQVLELLADGHSLSGELLGRKLGISRMAISKTISGLRDSGLEITSTPGKGYQLQAALQLLDQGTIRQHIREAGFADIRVEVLQKVDSTSDHLLQRSHSEDINRVICLAECQHSGRGRRERQWHASPYRNLILSIGWRFDEGMGAISGLAIAAGITIVRTLHEAGFDRDIGLKWPNDIIWQNKKLGGLLIDVRGESDGPCLTVLGLGLNLDLSGEDQLSIDQECTSLASISTGSPDRNLLISEILKGLIELFETYDSSGFARYQQQWTDYDRLLGHEVRVSRGERSFIGIACGIDEQGALLLDRGGAAPDKFFSGDVSLRRVQ